MSTPADVIFRVLPGSASPHTLPPETHVGRSMRSPQLCSRSLISTDAAYAVTGGIACCSRPASIGRPFTFTPSDHWHTGGRVFPNTVTIASVLEASFSPRAPTLPRATGEMRRRSRGHLGARAPLCDFVRIGTAAPIHSVPRLASAWIPAFLRAQYTCPSSPLPRPVRRLTVPDADLGPRIRA